jgi:DNA-binding transcriptional ArsR family regulator
LTAGDIAAHFAMSKPTISRHLATLESAGLVIGDKRVSFVHYSLVRGKLASALNGFAQEVCFVSSPPKRKGGRPERGSR